MSNRRSAALLLATITVLSSLGVLRAADPLPRVTKAEEVGISTERLERLTRVTQGHIDSGLLPGAVMLIARNGKIAYVKSLGYRDRASGAPMTEDSIFRIYSMTKPITSVAVMMLQEEGRLQITDPVSKYLPELARLKVGVEKADGSFATVDANREITIQDLLRHTSGFTYGNGGESQVHKLSREADIANSVTRGDSNATLVTKLSQLPLRSHPGTRWEYSVSTDVLGRVVEVISGKSLGAFFEERIFRPLGMQDTAFYIPPSKMVRAAQPWARPGGLPITPRFDVSVDAPFQSGGGGLVGTAMDYLRFTQMLLDGGIFNGVRLLSPRTVAYMTADHLGDLPGQGPGMGFGLGFQVRKEVGMAGLPGSVGEYGWQGNAGTLFRVDPKEKLIAIYMVQVSDTDRVFVRDQFRSLVSQAIVTLQ
jgi:CubicO group peptidase (beta-lactamase class C family)